MQLVAQPSWQPTLYTTCTPAQEVPGWQQGLLCDGLHLTQEGNTEVYRLLQVRWSMGRSVPLVKALFLLVGPLLGADPGVPSMLLGSRKPRRQARGSSLLNPPARPRPVIGCVLQALIDERFPELR